nr:Rieske 2Fe-2S domain-containing protein [Aeoliella straminimaris]
MAPPAEAFPTYPSAWYLFGRSRDIARQPFSKEFLGKRIVVYRKQDSSLVAMRAECAHLGSDLGAGRVVGDCVRCPFHDWEYGPDGACVRIPAQREIPPFARQEVFPVAEHSGLVFLFNGPEALYPLPFFDGATPADLSPSRPFGTVLDCPWYVSGANAFDLQHFRAAHDRRLLGDPSTDHPHPYAFRALGVFAVEGHSLQDRLTRRFGGDEVELGITDWCGGLSFATARLSKTVTRGLVAREPLADGRVRVQVIVFAKRSPTALGRKLFDPLQLEVRRLFIKNFLTADAVRLNGVRYDPHRLIQADADMIDYYRWLADRTADTPARLN